MKCTLTERHELKYVVPPRLVGPIRRFIQPYTELDAHLTARSAWHSPITSVYYDSPDLRMANSTLAGDRNRVKLRVRCYAEPGELVGDMPAFFEVKRKENGVVRKLRARTTLDNALALMRRERVEGVAGLLSEFRSDPVLHQFFTLCAGYQARSVVNVRYIREAYESRFHDNVRITLDSRLRSSPAKGCQWFEATASRSVPLGGIILEIKFTRAYPHWIADLVRRFDLQRRAVPKYVLCTGLSNAAACRNSCSRTSQRCIELP
jgi:hypothetical protein